MGLREGMKLAKTRGLHNIEIEMDVEAIVKAVNSDDNAVQGSGTLLSYCRNLLKNINFIRLHHTMREENKCADSLANSGHDGDLGLTILERPLNDMISFFGRTLQDQSCVEFIPNKLYQAF